MRVKFYFKTLALMQSESAAKSLGMNMKGIYYPRIRMGQALKESKDIGQSRIEITYTAVSRRGEDEILDDEFPLQSKIYLMDAETALRSVSGLTWHIPMIDL